MKFFGTSRNKGPVSFASGVVEQQPQLSSSSLPSVTPPPAAAFRRRDDDDDDAADAVAPRLEPAPTRGKSHEETMRELRDFRIDDADDDFLDDIEFGDRIVEEEARARDDSEKAVRFSPHATMIGALVIIGLCAGIAIAIVANNSYSSNNNNNTTLATATTQDQASLDALPPSSLSSMFNNTNATFLNVTMDELN